jgi:2-polyprenyl-6-methoxyphenol hydroxylase-like FAD-dependent oxidoreductase
MQQNVLVVGAGPVGLTMAAELARYGIAVRIIDKSPERTDKSKALVLWSRTLELLDRAGCGDAFVTAGLKVHGASITANGNSIAHISLNALQTPHPYGLMLPQSDTERLLEQHLNTYHIYVERQVELTQSASDTNKVTATLRHQDGHDETLDAAWMIGCDGAHSFVRHGLGMDFEGDTLPSHWILADVHLSGVPTPPDEIALYWHEAGLLVIFPITPGRYRVVADAGETQPDGHPKDPTLQQVQAVLDQRGPGGITASDPLWLAGFGINERKVADYRAGRVFLAGDAAHVHSPAGGQGMNTGMQDAFNLTWKLALVCKGHVSPEPLLDSYSTERSEIGRQVLRDSGRLTTVGTLKNTLLQSLRNQLASLVLGLSPIRRNMTNAMTELSIGYPNGPLSKTEKSRRSGPTAGERAPIATTGRRVGSGGRPQFALFAQPDSAGTALFARHSDLLDPEVRPPFEQDGIWLVRPDGYVAMTANTSGWDKVGAYLDWIAGTPSTGEE